MADTNVDREIVERLRQDGHEVLYVAGLAPGMSDDDVLKMANEQGVLLLTSDLDFGELVFRQRRRSSGVLLTRLPDLSALRRAETITKTVRERTAELEGRFSVLTAGGLRIRRAVP